MGRLWLGYYQWNLLVWWVGLGVVVQLRLLVADSQNSLRDMVLEDNSDQTDFIPHGVHLIQQNQHVVMSNGIVNVTLTVPDGNVASVTYKGSDNLLETQNLEDNRGLIGMNYKVIVQNKDQTEISFTTTWAVGSGKVPLNVDKRFVMLRGSPGFYTYTMLERLRGWPAFYIQEGRIVLKLQENKFHYMAMSDERQRNMPMPVDRNTGRVLDYPEAVLLTNPTNPDLKGEVDDKYLYSCDNKDNKVHGWVSNDPPVGVWMITPSNEFRTGGPLKQDLTSHVGPTILSMFISTHYAGEDIAIKFETQEYWKKVFGPVYVYLNSDVSAKNNPSVLWNDAKKRFPDIVLIYNSLRMTVIFFRMPMPSHFHIPKAMLSLGYKNKQAVPAASAYVGLAPPGVAGSWQLENKGYQFWTQTDGSGNFLIKNVIPGTYSLFAWVPGTIGDYKHASDITITSGSNVKANNVVFEAPRKGATIWEIGIPDRTAAEFFIPDPSPAFKLHKYPTPVEKFRQYGLWSRYNDYHPKTDLVYTIGQSDYRKDWFFAHVTRNMGNQQFQSTTWIILFDLKNGAKGSNYTLQLALASANQAELQVRLNNPNSGPHFTTGLIGKDNALARHGIHGLYHFYSIGIAGSQLVDGRNTIYLTQARNQGPFREVMYDYIRLEGHANA
ncbi:hypothetical protein BUALT_Bualt04G0034000 [Buddleja alternifolia]|uniref:rhamnogalacturonan endolyase n=1 Tax=Buddleja alternifolia TaxID=168488 RepID=A0AAV6XQB0_9LAMI|nr:hypothetical protein BUALT_Bualt04G0034000 [Buddleja alternifolia]